MLSRGILAITNQCNLRCLHCYADSGQECMNELTVEELDHIVDQIGSLNPKRLVISGGEPLMALKRLERVTRKAKEYGLFVGLTTNGILLSPDVAHWLKEIGIDSVQVSLDSDRPCEHEYIRGKGTFEKAVAGLQASIKAGLRTTVMMVAFKHNWMRLSYLVEKCVTWGVDLVAVDRFVRAGRGRTGENLQLGMEELAGLHQQLSLVKSSSVLPIETNDPIWNALQLLDLKLKDFDWAKTAPLGCAACLDVCVIHANGLVYPCTFLPIVIGDIRKKKLAEILAEHQLQDVRNRDLLTGKCGQCHLRYVCGGCRADAWVQSGNLLGEDPICPYVEEKNK